MHEILSWAMIYINWKISDQSLFLGDWLRNIFAGNMQLFIMDIIGDID